MYGSPDQVPGPVVHFSWPSAVSLPFNHVKDLSPSGASSLRFPPMCISSVVACAATSSTLCWSKAESITARRIGFQACLFGSPLPNLGPSHPDMLSQAFFASSQDLALL